MTLRVAVDSAVFETRVHRDVRREQAERWLDLDRRCRDSLPKTLRCRVTLQIAVSLEVFPGQSGLGRRQAVSQPIKFVFQPMLSRGTSTPCVARTTVQTQHLLNMVPFDQPTKDALFEAGFRVMKRLIVLEDIRERLGKQIEATKASIAEKGIPLQAGGQAADVPAVVDLEQDAERFLYETKLALRDIAGLFKPLHGQDFNHKFQKVRAWAEAAFGADDALVKTLHADASWIERVISMRNAVEHPTDPHAPLTIRNFTLRSGSAPWQVDDPSWFMKGEQPTFILQDMEWIAGNLLTFFEDILEDGLHRHSHFPLTITEIPEAERDPVCPVRLRATIEIKPPAT
jgi:hypothetical protein